MITRRRLRIALAILVALPVCHVIAANLFVSTPLFDKFVNAQEQSIQIRFERAWSLFPGRMHVKKLAIRGRDTNVEWRLTLDEATFHISLLGLVKRHFKASHIRGKGISFRLRERLAAEPATQEEIAPLPPIAGFPPYSVRPPKKPVTPEDVARSWTVDIEAVAADEVREVWVDHFRFEGSARVGGRFLLLPHRAIEVGPAHAAIARGTVSTRHGLVATALGGTDLDVTIARFDPERDAGAALLRRLTLAGELRASLPEIARLPELTPADLTLAGPIEVHRSKVHMKAGTVQRGTQVHATASGLVATTRGHRVRSDLALSADVADRPTGGADQVRFRAELARVSVLRQLRSDGPMRPILQAPAATIEGDARALGPTQPFADMHLLLEVPDASANARELSAYLPAKAPVELMQGSARADLRFEAWLAERRATGRGTLRADDLDLRLAQMRVRGQLAARAEFAAYHFDTRYLDGATLVIDAAEAVISSHAAPDKAHVHLNGARLQAHARRADIDEPLRTLVVSIAVPDARIASEGLLSAYLPKGSEMHVSTSHSAFSLHSELEIADHLARGSLALESRRLAIDYRDLRLTAHVGARARVHDWQWKAGKLALDDALVTVTDLAVTRSRGALPPTFAMRIPAIRLSAKSQQFTLHDPLVSLTLSAAFVDAEVRDFAAMNALLPDRANFALEGRQGKQAAFDAALDLAVRDHSGRGELRAKATDVGVRKGRTHLQGDVDLFARFSDWRFPRHTLHLLDSRVDMTDLTARFTPHGPSRLSAKRLALTFSTPQLDLAEPTLAGADFHFVFEGGELPDARALAPLLPADGIFGIESGAARVTGDIAVSSTRQQASGGLEIDIEHAAFRLHTTRLRGDFNFHVNVAGYDAQRQAIDLSGTRFEMRDVSVADSAAATSGWRGDLVFPRAWFELGRPDLFDGDLRLSARDARPLLALIFAKDLRGIVVTLTDMPHLDASLRVVADSHQLALLDLEAGGGTFELRGNYAVRRDHHQHRRRGGLIARSGLVSVGLRLDDEGTHVRLFGLNGWLQDHACRVSDQVQAAIASCPRPPVPILEQARAD